MKAFLDTMIWLHYQPIEDINPVEIATTDTPLTIVVPRITLKELDKHKNQHKSSKVRERARRALKLIEQVAADTGFRCKNGIHLELYRRPPNVDFEKLGLSKESADEYLIASILTYRSEYPGHLVRLYTEDTTPRIIAKPLGVDAIAFPEQFKLEPEPDLIEKENRDLKAELLRLRTARPVLECGFVVGAQRTGTLLVEITRPTEFPADRVASELRKLRAEYPHQHPPTHAKVDDRASALRSLLASGGLSIADTEYARYNREVDEYFAQVEGYFRTSYQHHVEELLSQSVEIQVANTGSVPAEDVDVWLHFPDGCVLYENLPDAPEEPEAPTPPQSEQERMLNNIVHQTSISDHLGNFSPLKMDQSFSLRKTHSYEVKDHFKRIKHGHSDSVSTLILTFSSFDAASSFEVEYRVTAANLPAPVTGSLNVKVKK